MGHASLMCLSKSHAAPTWMFWAKAVAWSTIDSSHRLSGLLDGQVHHMLRPNGHALVRNAMVCLNLAQWRLLSSCLTPKRNSDTCRNSGCQMDSGKEIWIDEASLGEEKNLSTQTIYTNTFSSLQSSISTTFILSKNRSALWTKDTEVPGLNSMCICFFLWIYC